MAEQRKRIDTAPISSAGNEFSFETGVNLPFAPKSFPQKLQNRLQWETLYGTHGWEPWDSDLNFTFLWTRIPPELVEVCDAYSADLGYDSFFTVDDFTNAARGEAIIVATTWFIKFIASYVAGRTLDVILNRLKEERSVEKWLKIEAVLKTPGQIRIVLPSNGPHAGSLLINDVPVSLRSLSVEEIDRIVQSVKNSSMSFMYNQHGLHTTEYRDGDILNVRI